jgi:hypothetical protein
MAKIAVRVIPLPDCIDPLWGRLFSTLDLSLSFRLRAPGFQADWQLPAHVGLIGNVFSPYQEKGPYPLHLL